MILIIGKPVLLLLYCPRKKHVPYRFYLNNKLKKIYRAEKLRRVGNRKEKKIYERVPLTAS